MLDQLFSNLEISANEAKLYQTLAELGKAPASLLAKRLSLPRSTVYTALGSLHARGLVAVEQTQELAYYVANQPEALLRMVEEEKKAATKKIEIKENSAKELMPFLEPLFKNSNFSVPKLQFFEGTANVRSMLCDYSQEWQRSISKFDYTWWGYQDHHFVETYRDWLDQYWAAMHPEEKIMLLSNPSETERKLKKKINRRTIKVMPGKKYFSSTIWVLGDYIVTIMTRQQPHYAVQLMDPVFASNQRLLFQMLWSFIGK